MPAQVRSEFALALNQVASERNISVETILSTIEEALLMAYRKDRGFYGEVVDVEGFIAKVDPNSGEASIFRKKEDGSLGENVTPPGFGRIAAQTAGQVLRQKIREAEKKAVIEDFSQRIGTLASGMVLRFDGPNVIVDIGRAEAVMPPQEQNQTERYHLNQRLAFYIKEIRETSRGQEVVVSRSHENLVVELFRKEVPEFQSGAVIVKLIAREAGGRTKLAVASTQSGVDPVGASVGQKGVRVQAVINELGSNEKVDVIQYTEDAAVLLASALAPAKEIEVLLNEKDKSAIALVPDDQLSLAIGREGQNVRLAAKLTGWKIDIKGKNEYQKPVLNEEAEKKEVPADQPTDGKKLKKARKKSAKSEDQNEAK
jgi:transcription termination/antitermination protein NusA